MPGDRWLVAGITALGALLRFACLSRAPADIDESWTWYFVHLARSGRGFWQTLLIGIDGPLFGSMNLLIGAVWGSSLLALRLPQAVFGTLAIPMAFAVFQRLWTRRVAIVATLLAALSPFLVFYSKHARPYAQLLFFCLLWVYAAERTRTWPAWRRYLALATTAALAVATHYYALVFLGSVYLIQLASHLLARRRIELWREVREGLVTLAVLSPLLLLFLAQLVGLSMPYWKRDRVGLAAIWTEEFLLLGSSLGAADGRAAWFHVIVASLLLAPYGWFLWRRRRQVLNEPFLLVGPAMPILVSALVGQGNLFFPRGFIPSVPFLLAGWVRCTSEMESGRSKRVYATLLIVPFLVSSYSVATSHPGHGFFRGREIMPEIVDRARSFEHEYDLLLVHHWWLAQYVSFYHPEPARVRGLGMERRGQASRSGELAAVMADVAALPRGARLLLMRNDLASEVDSRDLVVATLRARRPLLRELPCRENPVPGESLLCQRMFLFGPDTPDGSGTSDGRTSAGAKLR
jgi:hypothetical protein